VKRREFIALFGGTVAWPLSGLAQQPSVPVVGFPSGGLSRENESSLAAFRKGLGDVGFFQGQNVALEVRTTDRNDELPALAAELVRHRVSLIFATGNANSAQAAKAATSTIPIVFANGSDPVSVGLVASMNRPGGNLTGVSYYTGALGAKRLELLREVAPRVSLIGILINPSNPVSRTSLPDLQKAAAAISQSVTALAASTPDEIDRAFANGLNSGIEALLVDAGFEFVPEPLPMRNSNNAVVYYLFFASQKPVAKRIIEDIFAKHR
jgi:putative tryptophan/tyrosine transport system substrate-binding protein